MLLSHVSHVEMTRVVYGEPTDMVTWSRLTGALLSRRCKAHIHTHRHTHSTTHRHTHSTTHTYTHTHTHTDTHTHTHTHGEREREREQPPSRLWRRVFHTSLADPICLYTLDLFTHGVLLRAEKAAYHFKPFTVRRERKKGP